MTHVEVSRPFIVERGGGVDDYVGPRVGYEPKPKLGLSWRELEEGLISMGDAIRRLVSLGWVDGSQLEEHRKRKSKYLEVLYGLNPRPTVHPCPDCGGLGYADIATPPGEMVDLGCRRCVHTGRMVVLPPPLQFPKLDTRIAKERPSD